MHPSPARSSRLRSRCLALAAAAVAGLGVAALSAPAASAATPAEIGAAVERGADYLAAQQTENGRFPGFGGDWTVSSLAAAGRDVDAIRATPNGPSALAAYRAIWTSGPEGDQDWTSPSSPTDGPPRPAASDYARATLIAHAAGLEPTRLAADQNLVAQLAGMYRGRPVGGEDPDAGRIEGNFGSVDAFDGAISSLLALSRAAVPQVLLDVTAEVVRSNQLDNGAWSYLRVYNAADRANASIADPDTTGQAIAALCDAGVRPSDPAIARGLAYLRTKQLDNGGFVNDWTPNGNTNTTAATVFALNSCGIDPQSAEYVTASQANPLDYLLAQQLTSGEDVGAFGYATGDTAPNLYASQEAVRALTGSGYVAEPSRSVASPTVADGTVVPQALAIDAGIDETGERDLRFCRVQAPVGATVARLLELAAASAQPSGCVTDLTVADGTVRALNGVAGDSAQRTWLARVENGSARRAGDQPVCHGQLVTLYVGRAADASSATTEPCTARVDPPVDPTPQPPSPVQPTVVAPTPAASKVTDPSATAPTPRVTVAGRSGAQRAVRLDRKGRLRITLSCPKAAGPRGCWSVVEARATYRATPRGEARNRRVGGRTIRITAGRSRTVTVPLSPALRRDLRRVGTRRVQFVIRTRGEAEKTSRAVVTVPVRPAARS